MTTLILISIGPVQEFIAAARKLRDLWFGSYCLSELSKTVARSLQQQGVELIFPNPESTNELAPGSELIVANKILGCIPDGMEPEQVANTAAKAWRTAWKEYGSKALKTATEIGLTIDESLFDLQINDIGEYYAVWTEISGPDGYDRARKRVEILLAGRKAMRDFTKPTWEGAGLYKSSLDGCRECVVLSKKNNFPSALLKTSERLDALGIIKRFYPLSGKAPHFDDLSDIAVIPYLDRLAHLKLKPCIDVLELALKGTEAEKSTTAKRHSRIALNVYSDILYTDDQRLPEQARAALKSLYKQADAKPDPYACILVGDGDSMGKMLDGLSDQTAHMQFSRELACFARDVQTLVDSHDGRLIYSGGDDVLAYLPLHKAIQAADCIRLAFTDCMKRFQQSVGKTIDLPTFSIGLATIHHGEPLGNAFALARKAEQIAKHEKGRNAVVILQSKRSGGELSIGGKWSDRSGSFMDRLEAMITMLLEKELPVNLGYQLREISGKCGRDLKFADNGTPLNAAAALVKRLIEHKEAGDELVPRILNGATDVRRLSDEIVIANQFARARKLADPTTGGL